MKTMKKIWKVRKDREGVSPVIATILMVAITVVLAAVLYVMVFQIDPDVEFDKGGTIEDIKIRDNQTVEIEFGTFSGLEATTISLMLEDMNGDKIPGGEVTGKVIARREWMSFLSGVTLYFAGVVVDPALPARVRTVTNTVALTLF